MPSLVVIIRGVVIGLLSLVCFEWSSAVDLARSVGPEIWGDNTQVNDLRSTLFLLSLLKLVLEKGAIFVTLGVALALVRDFLSAALPARLESTLRQMYVSLSGGLVGIASLFIVLVTMFPSIYLAARIATHTECLLLAGCCTAVAFLGCELFQNNRRINHIVFRHRFVVGTMCAIGIVRLVLIGDLIGPECLTVNFAVGLSLLVWLTNCLLSDRTYDTRKLKTCMGT